MYKALTVNAFLQLVRGVTSTRGLGLKAGGGRRSSHATWMGGQHYVWILQHAHFSIFISIVVSIQIDILMRQQIEAIVISKLYIMLIPVTTRYLDKRKHFIISP